MLVERFQCEPHFLSYYYLVIIVHSRLCIEVTIWEHYIATLNLWFAFMEAVQWVTGRHGNAEPFWNYAINLAGRLKGWCNCGTRIGVVVKYFARTRALAIDLQTTVRAWRTCVFHTHDLDWLVAIVHYSLFPRTIRFCDKRNKRTYSQTSFPNVWMTRS